MDLKDPDKTLLTEITKRQTYLNNIAIIRERGFYSISRANFFLTLCKKINLISLPHPLKMCILLDTHYKLYCFLTQRHIAEDNTKDIEAIFEQFVTGVKALIKENGPLSAYYEILNILIAQTYYHRYKFSTQNEIDCSKKATLYFEEAMHHHANSHMLPKKLWIQSLRKIVFVSYYYLYAAEHLKFEILDDFNIKDSIINLIQGDKKDATPIIWLQNSELLPEEVSIFSEQHPTTTSLNKGTIIEDLMASLLLEQLIIHFHLGNPPDEDITKMLVHYLEENDNIDIKEVKILHDIDPVFKAEHLLTFCEKVDISKTYNDGCISFILTVYYGIYCCFANIDNDCDTKQSIIYRFLKNLKQLLNHKNTHSKFHEIIYILLCGAFDTPQQLYISINANNQVTEFGTFESYFSEAIQNHAKNTHFFNNSWTTHLRISVLKLLVSKLHSFQNIESILKHLMILGDNKAGKWLNPEIDSILPLKERETIISAMRDFSTIVWMANTRLINKDDLELNIIENVMKKIATLHAQLDNSYMEESILYLAPLMEYAQEGDPLNIDMQPFFKMPPNLNTTKLLEQRHKTIKNGYTEAQGIFLIEVCLATSKKFMITPKENAYLHNLQEIIKLDIYQQTYHFLKKRKLSVLDLSILAEMVKDIHEFESYNQPKAMLYEILNILLFQISFSNRQISTFLTNSEPHDNNPTELYLIEAIESQSRSTAQIYFSNAISSASPIFFRAGWADNLRRDAVLSYAQHFLSIKILNQRSLLGHLVLKLKAMGKKGSAFEILNWLYNIQLVTKPTTIKKTKNTKKEQVVCPPLKIKHHHNTPKTNTQLNLDLEKQTKEHQEKVKMQEAIESKQLSEALKQKKVEQATLREQRHGQTPNKTQAIQLKLALNKDFRTHNKTISALITENAAAAQAREASIAERALRSLRDFNINTLTYEELPLDNQSTLKSLIAILPQQSILEFYGSYVVFLASLRLDVATECIRRPGDLDLRIIIPKNHEIITEEIYQKTLFSKNLLALGFVLNNLPKTITNTCKLYKYISDQIVSKGYLSLSLKPKDTSTDSYTIELTVRFSNHYHTNTNPFRLLKHYITIKKDNVASFDSRNPALKKQLADDILNNKFCVNTDVVLDLKYNVFNFFTRALKNRAWGKFFDIQELENILNNLEFIKTYFSNRFASLALSARKNCYLEMAGLITNRYFQLSDTKLILEGFLFAIFEKINLESKKIIGNEIFPKDEITHNIENLTYNIWSYFSVQAQIQDETTLKNPMAENFYNYLLMQLKDRTSGDCQGFLCSRSADPNSVLYDMFKTREPSLKSSLKPMCFSHSGLSVTNPTPSIPVFAHNVPSAAFPISRI